MKLLKQGIYREQDCSHPSINVGHWANLRRFPATDYSGLFGSHGLYRGQKGIYLYRDGRDVALSVWKSKGFMHPDWEGISFSDFLKRPLDWWLTPGTKQNNSTIAIVQHWKLHLDSWHKRPGVYYVRFVDLVDHPEQTVKNIADWIGRPFLGITDPGLVGISPNKGQTGGWRTVFSEQDLKLFHNTVPKDFWGLNTEEVQE